METDTLSRRVGQLLRTLRKERRWTLDKASVELNYKPSTLGAYERANRMMDLDTLEELLAAYGVPLQHFLNRLMEATPETGRSQASRERVIELNDAIRRAAEEIATIVLQTPEILPDEQPT